MKKYLAFIIAALVVTASLAACKPNLPPKPTEEPTTKATQSTTPEPETTTEAPTTTAPTTTAPDSATEEVDFETFYDVFDGDNIRWTCAGQYSTDYIEFAIEDGQLYLIMGRENEDYDEYAVAQVDKIYYDGNADVVTLMISEYTDELPSNVFTIEMERFDDGYIMANNYYADYSVGEYASQEYGYNIMFEYQDPELNEAYYPYLGLSSDGNFVMCENYYEGMMYFYGTYELTDDEVICTVTSTDPASLDGIAGGDTKTIYFWIDEDGNLLIEQDICYTRYGALFTYVGEY